MARPIKASDFNTAFEYEQAKKQARKQSQAKRSSPEGRRSYNMKGSDE